MRQWLSLFFVVVIGSSAFARNRQPYEGIWASNVAACRAEDGVDRLVVEADLFQWYETRCRARSVSGSAVRSWTLRFSCEGEGHRFRARSKLSLSAPDKLIMDDSPVGPTRRQIYVRCKG